MKNLTTTNSKSILNLFKGWGNTLPYNTGGRPSYSSDELKKYSETQTVNFTWNEIPSKVEFIRMVAGSTNFHWGMRDEGVIAVITIGNIVIDVNKETSWVSWQYGTSFKYRRNFQVEARLKRILTALSQKETPKFKPTDLVYIERYTRWLSVQSIIDYDAKDKEFIYEGKHTPQDSPYQTFYFSFYESTGTL